MISLKKLNKTAGGSWGPPGGLEHGKIIKIIDFGPTRTF